MPFDPREFIQILKEYNISFDDSRSSIILTCPKCGKEKLYIRKKDGVWICFYCSGTQGRFKGNNYQYILANITGLSLDEVREKLGVKVDQLQSDLQYNNETIIQEVIYPPDFYPITHSFSIDGMRYLNGRGIPDNIAIKYNIMYCPPTRRVVFPIIVDSKLVGWQARAIFDNEYLDLDTGEISKVPKIMTSKNAPRDRCFMFQDNLTNSDYALITEGPIDCIKADLCGGNVASMGKYVTDQQLDIIRNNNIKKIYLGLDPDASVNITELVNRLFDMEIYWIQIPCKYHDLGEMTFEEVYYCFKKAIRVDSSSLFI